MVCKLELFNKLLKLRMLFYVSPNEKSKSIWEAFANECSTKATVYHPTLVKDPKMNYFLK